MDRKEIGTKIKLMPFSWVIGKQLVFFLAMQMATTTTMFYLCYVMVGLAWASIMAVFLT